MVTFLEEVAHGHSCGDAAWCTAVVDPITLSGKTDTKTAWAMAHMGPCLTPMSLAAGNGGSARAAQIRHRHRFGPVGPIFSYFFFVFFAAFGFAAAFDVVFFAFLFAVIGMRE